jgi:hypothetical protein
MYQCAGRLPHHRRHRLDGGDALSAAAVRLSLRAEPGSKQSETFKVMERRLLKAIINPAMIVTWVLGCGWPGRELVRGPLAARQARPRAGMMGVHGILSKYVREFAATAPKIREILPDSQRGTDRPLDPHRDPAVVNRSEHA